MFVKVLAIVAVAVFSAVVALVFAIHVISSSPQSILDHIIPDGSSEADIQVSNQAMDSNDFDVGEQLYIRLINAPSENIFWLFQHEHLVRGGTSINTSAIDLKPKDLGTRLIRAAEDFPISSRAI